MLYSEDIFETKEKKKKGERLSMKKIIEIRKFQYKRIANKQTEKSQMIRKIKENIYKFKGRRKLIRK